jgi:predicted Fe-S protein YdhL (DUF1289 family)
MWERSEGKISTIHHVGQSKWAEMTAWETLDDETQKEVILRKLDQQIMKKEFKLEYLKHTVETLEMIRQAMKTRYASVPLRVSQ